MVKIKTLKKVPQNLKSSWCSKQHLLQVFFVTLNFSYVIYAGLMLSINQFTKQIFLRVNLSKNRYQYYSEAIRELGSGLLIAFALTLFIEDQVMLYKFVPGVFTALFLWYIGSRLFERGSS